MFEQTEGTPLPNTPQAAPQRQTAPGAPLPPGPPTALMQGKLQPVTESLPAVPPGQVSGTAFPVKKLIIMIVISVGVIGTAAGAVYVWQKQSAPVVPAPAGDAPVQDTVTADTQEVAPDQNDTSGQPDAGSNGGMLGNVFDNFKENSMQGALDPFNTGELLDTDEDGLTDEKEYDLGTNPRLVDSDSDGLSDWEEIRIFDTDPLNNDSDGDTYLDGEEVQNGYDPNGSGRLLDFEGAKDALNE